MPLDATAKPDIFRFAPSPNGDLHLGHAYSALVSYQLAQRTGGRFLLRLEDVDMQRAMPEFVEHIYDDLDWLGLDWEQPVRVQSRHMDDYADALDKLREMSLVYPCFASRSEIRRCSITAGAPRTPDGGFTYPGIYRDLDPLAAQMRIKAGEPYAMRLNMQKALAAAGRQETGVIFHEWDPQSDEIGVIHMDPSVWGDIVIARKDIKSSYTLSVVVDDALQGVTHVTRGMDLFHATCLQVLLQILLDLPHPVYHHHQLVLDDRGEKLSKSRHASSLRKLRRNGLTREQLTLLLPPMPLG